MDFHPPQGRLYVLSAPSGGGKTSLTRALLPRLAALGVPAELSVSHTTRTPRPGETDGVHYHFVDEATFLEMIAAHDFLEHAHVFGRRYGTSRAHLAERVAAGVDVILDIDWQGHRLLKASGLPVTGIFILPPTREALAERLGARGQDSAETISARMAEATAEMSHWSEFDAVIVNDDFDTALNELTALFIAPRMAREVQAARHAGLIARLMPSIG